MAVMPYICDSSGSASVSTLAKTASSLRSETRSKIGANWRQGPHHDAQKSMRTMPSLTVWSWSVLVMVRVATGLSFSDGATGHQCPGALGDSLLVPVSSHRPCRESRRDALL